MGLKIKQNIRGRVVLLAVTSLFGMTNVALSEVHQGKRLTVGFLVAGGQSNTPLSQTEHEGEVFGTDRVLTAENLLEILNAKPSDDQPRSKFQNATLLVSVENDDGSIQSRESVAFCRQLDLYAEPVAPDAVKARCDVDLYEYSVTKEGIAFLRNGQEIGSFELDAGFYLINGAMSPILSP